MSYDYATNSELREASRDSGVDVNTPGIPETHSTLPKDEKFKIENKNTIPKYKFNQKKQNLRKQIQKPPFDNSKLPAIETRKLPKLGNNSQQTSHKQSTNKNTNTQFGLKQSKKPILPKISNSPKMQKRGKSDSMGPIGPQITKLKGSPPKIPSSEFKTFIPSKKKKNSRVTKTTS